LKSNLYSKNVNYDNLEDEYYSIINDLDDDYIAQFIQFEQNNFLEEFQDVNGNFTELEYKLNSPPEKYLKYIINFEIVDKDTKDLFIKNNIAKEEHFISLYSYISEIGKILIIFDKDNINFYEVGHFNDNEDFIIEYLIDELENINKYYIADYFLDNGIDFINKSQSVIDIDKNWETRKCIFYKIQEEKVTKEIKAYQTFNINNNNNIDKNVDFIDNKIFKDIFSILLSIFLFEKDILKSSNLQGNNENKRDVILLSNQFLIDLKNLFFYNKVFLILEKINISSNYDIEEVFKKFSEVRESENILRLINKNEKEFEKNKEKAKEYFIFEQKLFSINSEQNLLYPDKFCI